MASFSKNTIQRESDNARPSTISVMRTSPLWRYILVLGFCNNAITISCFQRPINLDLMGRSITSSSRRRSQALTTNMVLTRTAPASTSSSTADATNKSAVTPSERMSQIGSTSKVTPSNVPHSKKQQSVTSSLISHLAECALKMRLTDQSGVSCDVTADPGDIFLRGNLNVGPVTVSGKNWRSSLGLTCRMIEATVQTCTLDVGKVVRDRKLRLVVPAEGESMVALNSEDFGNFITHPLIKPLTVRKHNGNVEHFQFLKDDVVVDALRKEVTFFGNYQGQKWRCTLRRKSSGAVVRVEAIGGREDLTTSMELTKLVSNFFNKLIFELDGVFLSYRDLMITEKGNSPTVLLALAISVHKFPSARASF